MLLHGLLLDDAQDVQGGGLDAADVSDTIAARAGRVAAFLQAGLQSLTRQLEQSEARYLAGLHACTVVVQRIAQAVLDLTLVAGATHVDKIDHDQAA